MIFLDENFPENPQIVAAGPHAGWLYVAGLGWLKRTRSTTGLIPKAQVRLLAVVPRSTAGKLVEIGWWVDQGEAYEVKNYLLRNARDIAKKEQARSAARKRWDVGSTGKAGSSTGSPPGGLDADAYADACADVNADAHADGYADADATKNQRTREPVVVVNPPYRLEPLASAPVVEVPNEPERRSPRPTMPQSAHRFVAHDLAEEVFAGPAKPIESFSRVVDLLASALAAGRTPDVLRGAVLGGEVTWTKAGVSTALAKAERRAPRASSNPYAAIARAEMA